ncbi:MAG: UDP-N-acetylglucosamine 1-carboxyvinyltransferase [Caldisericia bacterium]|nr:UDP-N-acetylglucosamine 1-carboxyvinyltransferase [Caldisericia bacterium]MDD4614331.1 UDP-N-acetylglucosamine 1-carboxyvinyltransferase [Caldisericia bacterium]
MSQFVIQGKKPLKGRVQVSGSKNAALPIITATLLIKGPVEISNIPDMGDVRILIQAMEDMGVKIDQQSEDCYVFDASGEIQSDLTTIKGVNTIRGSQTLLGALLARNREVMLPILGGCRIGSRPMDIHFQNIEKMNTTIENIGNRKFFKTPQLKGTHIYMDYSSVGATENLILAATGAEGITIIENAAQEPEIVDLVYFLNKAGARITGLGSKTLQIIGNSTLQPIDYHIMPDRIETGTFMVAGAITNGEVHIEKCSIQDMSALLFKMRDTGVQIDIKGQSTLTVTMSGRPKAFSIRTMPFPGFPTDLQSLVLAMACYAHGTSVIKETIYENRFNVVPELRKMGAIIMTDNKLATVTGVDQLYGAEVECPDLRGGAALILASLAAEGTSYVHKVNHVDRGYQCFEKKLQSLGASIVRVEEEHDDY